MIEHFIKVLTLHENQPAHGPQVLFTEDDNEPGTSPQSLYINRDVFENMGSPTQITLTVLPGDARDELEE